MKINKSGVDGLIAGEKPVLWWDESLKGFGVKITSKGSKTYLVQYRLPGRRKSATYTIGRHGSPWTAEAARKEAQAKILAASQGVDPNGEKRALRAETIDYSFDAYVDHFTDNFLATNWPGSFSRMLSIIRCHAKPFFKGRDIRQIGRRDCAALIDSVAAKPATARKVKEVVGRMFTWAEQRGDVEFSPMARVPVPKPSLERERVLSDEELKAVWQAADTMNHPYGSLVQFLILGGQRRSEAGRMLWSEVDTQSAVWRLPGGKNKSRKVKEIPLTPSMVRLLTDMPRVGEMVFSVSGDKELGNHSKLKVRLDNAIAKAARVGAEPMEAWTLHDIRRTVATGLQRLKISPDMIELVQGRTLKLGAGQRYQKYSYLPEKRAVMEQWDAHVTRILAVANSPMR